MPFATAPDRARINFEVTGDPVAPPLMLSNSLGTTLEMWSRQLDAFDGFRLIRFDTRGHGGSDAPAGEYDVATLGGDALAVLDEAGVQRTHFCGLSLGGAIGQWMTLHAPERIDRLVLANTAPAFGSPEVWRERIEAVRSKGMAALAHGVIDRWFTPEFRERDPAEVDRILAMLLACSPEGYAGCAAAVRDSDFRDRLGEIGAPTLVIGGRRDPSTPPAVAQALADGVPGARLMLLEAAHMSANEQPDAFNQAVLAFLS